MIGPRVTIEKSCYGCECEKVEHYAVQGDSGCYVNCTHKAVGEKRIGNDSWTTPEWCPADNTAKPVAWIRFCSDGGYEGPLADCDKRMDGTRKTSGAWTPLFATPNAAVSGRGAATPEAKDDGCNASA